MTFRTMLVLAALVVMTTGLASADTIITTNAVPVGTTLTDFNFSLVFPATATPAGTHLVGATLEIDATIKDPTLSLTNTANSSQTFKFTATSEADILTNAVDGTFVGSNTAPTTILATGLVTFTAGQVTTYSPITVNEILGPTAVTNAAGYLVGDTVTGATSSGTTFVGGGGNIKVQQVQNGLINGKLVFDFAPNQTGTPEPGTFLLMGAGLAVVGLFRRRTAR